ncbi:MAG: hypothetical protein IPH20_16655 [Bacteroidales bacterium]|nr:hypothetical protein [Bacteroidales bacterium]
MIWADVSTSLQRDDSGNPLYFLTIIIDITNQKRSVWNLKSEEGYNAYILLTGQIDWLTNAIGEVENDIPSFRKYTGLTYEEVEAQDGFQPYIPMILKKP